MFAIIFMPSQEEEHLKFWDSSMITLEGMSPNQISSTGIEWAQQSHGIKFHLVVTPDGLMFVALDQFQAPITICLSWLKVQSFQSWKTHLATTTTKQEIPGMVILPIPHNVIIWWILESIQWQSRG